MGDEELRADAARNRAAIVAAAQQVFGEQGLDAPIDEIARRAGVGNATLYRRFPHRAALIAAVFTDRLRDHVDAVEAALAQPDPWSGFRSYVLAVCEMQVRDRGLADLVTMRPTDAPEVVQLQARAYAGFVQLVERAKDAGTLRADFTPEDLVIVLMANAGLVHRTHASARHASRRLAHVLLDGFHAQAASAGPRAPSRRRMIDAMTQSASGSGCPTTGLEPRAKLLRPAARR